MRDGLEIPADLFGRRAKDPAWRVLAQMVRLLTGFTRHLDSKVPAGQALPVPLAMTLVVRRVVQEADEVVSLRLAAPDNAELPAWQPGCHVDLVLPSGLLRQYSLCGDPADRRSYRIAVRRIADGGGGSREVHTLTEGTVVTVRGPRNAFPFIGQDQYLFLAGGIGITPILPMVREAARLGADWRFVYSGRSRSSMPFLDELSTLDSDRVLIRPDDECGVASAAELMHDIPSGATIYCCGPPPMIDAVRDHVSATWSHPLHYERFSPPPIVDGAPFEIELSHSGRVLQVPADRSALQVIKEAIPSIGYSCQQGFCGTCRVRVLAGAVEHNDHALTDTQRADSMTICVSRAKDGRLVLDI